ncbi:MAG: DNA-3-methyladenine glycosylase 2 family protein [Alphaproteobacteria bacterium]|nr:DNA-3-methyladenine glycosylase 2 family protein [Alphaproteobacteria bacterium]
MAATQRRRQSLIVIETEADILRGVRSLRRRCPVMRKVHTATGDPPLRRREPGFEGLARIVVGQQLSVASANAIWSRCVDAIQPMSAPRIMAMTDDELRLCGLSGPKIRTLRAVAVAVIENGLDLETAADVPDTEMREALLAVSGIGPWTADIFQMFCLGRPDAFAPGDLALQVAAQHAFDLDCRPGAVELELLAEPWRPWRAVSARLLWAYYAVVKQGRAGIGV